MRELHRGIDVAMLERQVQEPADDLDVSRRHHRAVSR
jgi:hypothetical protein